jgi:hypothetical protein
MDTITTNSVIRLAQSQDIQKIIEVVWANVSPGSYKDKIIFKGETLRAFVGALLADDMARVIVYERDGAILGVFAFTVFPNFFYFAGQLVASMVVWSVAKPARGRISMKLLSFGQREAKNLGAKYMVLTGPNTSFDELCCHCGYSFLETSHIREL